MQAFISHASSDDGFADKLRLELRDSGIDTWVDHHDVPAGAEWVASIQAALMTCDIMILLLSNAALKSAFVGKEWMAFVNAHKPILPLVIESIDPSVEIPLWLKSYQMVDFRDPARFIDQIDVVVAALPHVTVNGAPTKKLSENTPRPMPGAKRDDHITETIDVTLLKRRDATGVTQGLSLGQVRFVIFEHNSIIVRDVRSPLKIGHYDGTKSRPGLDLANYDPTKNGISREHAVISPIRNGYGISDLNSTNGTWIGKNQLAPGKLYNLKNDSVIRLGWLLIRVEFIDQQT